MDSWNASSSAAVVGRSTWNRKDITLKVFTVSTIKDIYKVWFIFESTSYIAVVKGFLDFALNRYAAKYLNAVG